MRGTTIAWRAWEGSKLQLQARLKRVGQMFMQAHKDDRNTKGAKVGTRTL